MAELAGSTLDDRFRLLHRIGSGGMGDVWVAHDDVLEKPVAIKVMKQRFANQPDLVERFHRESRAVSQVRHDNVVVVHEVGTCKHTTIPYIAMELLVGESLRMRIGRGRMSIGEASAFVVQILGGLAAAHAAGIIHRDVKPENILIIDGTQRLKLLDFGLARRFEPGDTMTLPGSFVGTPGYAAPEVTLGVTSRDPKSDLYAVGAIWWEMLVGRPMFSGPTAMAVSLMHATEPALKPSKFVTVPLPVEVVLMKLLEKEPARRIDANTALAALAKLA